MQIRLAELLGSLSLATDLGMGDPLETALRSTLISMRMAERAGLDAATRTDVYYVTLLQFVGCTAESHVIERYFPDEFTMKERMNPVSWGSDAQAVRTLMGLMAGGRGLAAAPSIARKMPAMMTEMPEMRSGHCEVARMLGSSLGVPGNVPAMLGAVDERWDGRGFPAHAKGEDIPLPVRIASVARDAEWQRQLGGAARAAEVIGARAGKGHDPALAAMVTEHAEDLLGGLDDLSAWDEVLSADPAPGEVLEGERLDRALEVCADFADLKSPYLREHSRTVAALASGGADRCGFGEDDTTAVRRAGLVHDMGRVAVSVVLWDRAGPLPPDDMEKVRLHAYHTERVLSRSPALASIARLASMHHERLDGSGYHRGVDAVALPPGARLLAAADAYAAMTQPRPYREALTPEVAAKELRADVERGRLDAEAVAAVLAAAGHKPASRRSERAAGLTARECEVLRLIAQGLPTKTIARRLEISPKTADNHIQKIYAKCGVSTRAGATLFAMQNGLCSEAV